MRRETDESRSLQHRKFVRSYAKIELQAHPFIRNGARYASFLQWVGVRCLFFGAIRILGGAIRLVFELG